MVSIVITFELSPELLPVDELAWHLTPRGAGRLSFLERGKVSPWR